MRCGGSIGEWWREGGEGQRDDFITKGKCTWCPDPASTLACCKSCSLECFSLCSPYNNTHAGWLPKNSSSQPRPRLPQRQYICMTSLLPPPYTHSNRAQLHPTRSHMSPPTTPKEAQSLQYKRTRLSSTSGHGKRCVFAVSYAYETHTLTQKQKQDQMHLKLHLPEKMTCFTVSPNGYWAAAGSPNGHIYLWELSSGLLVSSHTAHYRALTSLTFTPDSRLLISTSLDSSVHVYLVSQLIDPEDPSKAGKPYGTLKDHNLAVRCVGLGRVAGSEGGRLWTASDDGTVKVCLLFFFLVHHPLTPLHPDPKDVVPPPSI